MSKRTRLAPPHAAEEEQFDLEAWTRIMNGLGYKDDASRAKALKIHHSQISRIRSGQARPGMKFVHGCTRLGIPFPAIFRKRTAGAQQ